MTTNNLNKITLFSIFFICILFPSFAQSSDESNKSENSLSHQFMMGGLFAYDFPYQESSFIENGAIPVTYGVINPDFTPIGNDTGRELGSTWGGLEFQVWSDYTLTIPMLAGKGMLTKGNNLQLNSKIEISPVTMALNMKATLTPIAFLKFEVGSHLGTGWYIDGLANGLGLNSDGTGTPETTSFPGIIYRGWIGGTFQFDLSAVLPEPTDWTHIVVQSSIKFEYQVFSAATEGEAWQYLADPGENHNGWRFLTSNVLGYQIIDFPINLVGFMVETETYLGSVRELSPMDENGWGSDYNFVRMGPLFNWQINKNHSLLFIAQWANKRLYSSETLGANYFKNRETENSYYMFFERIAVSYTMKF